MRFDTPNVKFNVLNIRMEWHSLLLCTDEEIKLAIRLAWIGIPPVTFGPLPPELKFPHGQYPVNLRRQVLDRNVKKI